MRAVIQNIVVILTSFVLIWESWVGLGQVFGWRSSGSVMYAITGHFSNPGPYGGFIAVLLAIVAAWLLPCLHEFGRGERDKVLWERDFRIVVIVIAGVASFFGGVVLLASLSRSAWAGFVLAAVVFLLREHEHTGLRLTRPGKVLPFLCLLLLLLGSLAFLVKKDSALGRLHIWRIECRVLAGHPLRGVGDGHGLGAYGLEQAEFFAEKERSELVKRIAGCPEYAFNEYLGIGMEHGFPGFIGAILLVSLVIGILLKNRSPFAYGAIVYAVFAFGSYPLSLWQFRVLGLALVIAAAVSVCSRNNVLYIIASASGLLALVFAAAAIRTAEDKRLALEREWSSVAHFSHLELYEDALEGLAELYPSLKDNYRFLYDYGYALFKTERYGEALRVLAEGATLSCDPMFHNIMGRCHEALAEYDQAEAEYTLSHLMVPGRLYPLVLLKEMCERLGNQERADSALRLIHAIPVNPRNNTMKELLERANDITMNIL